MEAVGAASAIIGIICAINELVALGKRFQGTVDKVYKNHSRIVELTNHIVDLLESLQVVSQHTDVPSGPSDLQNSIYSLQSDLDHAYRGCQKLVKSKLTAWKQRGEIQAEIENIERKILYCRQLFMTRSCIRIEKSLLEHESNMRERLDRVEALLRRSVIEAESNPAKAKSLLGVPSMTRPQMEKALENARSSVELESVPRFSLEDRYLRIKIKTLVEVLNDSSPDDPLRFPAPDTSVETQDVVTETLRILQLFRSDKISQPTLEVAKNLQNLAVALYDMGMYHDACEISKWVVEIFRRLPLELDDSYLAMALDNHSVYLLGSTRGKPTLQAVRAREEAVSIYRRIVDAGWDHFQSYLACSLQFAARYLGKLGHHHDALKKAEESLHIFRLLVHDHPEKYRDKVAWVLDDISGILLRMGRHKEAVRAAGEAVEICRTHSPDGIQLALVLNNYAVCLRHSKRFVESLQAAQESVKMRRPTLEKQSTAFKAIFADSLVLEFDILVSLQRHPLAAEIIQEAVTILRDLAHDHPNMYNNKFALSLKRTSRCLMSVGQYKQALETIQESLPIFNSLALGDPTKYNPYYAASFDNMYVCLDQLGLHAQALVAVERAIKIRCQETQTNPDPLLALSLSRASRCLRMLGRGTGTTTEGLAKARAAADTYRCLARSQPERFQSELLLSLHNLAIHLNLSCEPAEATKVIQEAAKLRWVLDCRRSHIKKRMAESLIEVSRSFDKGAWSRNRGAEAALESVRIYLTTSLLDISRSLIAAGHKREGRAACDESFRIYQRSVTESLALKNQNGMEEGPKEEVQATKMVEAIQDVDQITRASRRLSVSCQGAEGRSIHHAKSLVHISTRPQAKQMDRDSIMALRKSASLLDIPCGPTNPNDQPDGVDEHFDTLADLWDLITSYVNVDPGKETEQAMEDEVDEENVHIIPMEFDALDSSQTTAVAKEDEEEKHWLDSSELRREMQHHLSSDGNGHNIPDWESDSEVSSREADETMVGETEEETFLSIPEVDLDTGPVDTLDQTVGMVLTSEETRFLVPRVDWDSHLQDSPEVEEKTENAVEAKLEEQDDNQADAEDFAAMIPLSPLSKTIVFAHHLLLFSCLYFHFFQT